MISKQTLHTLVIVFIYGLFSLIFISNLHAARFMENLDRGVVAVYRGSGQVYIGWRMFATDSPDVAFDIYRDSIKINAAPITNSTNYIDYNGSLSSVYSVAAIGGSDNQISEAVSVWSDQHHEIVLHVPDGGTTPDGVSYTYSPNDASVGDVDGDGQYEIILKWDPSNSKDNSKSGYTGNVYLDAYEIDGTFLWRIDLGMNIRAGAHYTQFMVYDFDLDGRAEIACKTADGTVDGLGVVIGDSSADYRNSSGYILSGPEYFTVFDGQTGAALATVDYIPPRHPDTLFPTGSQLDVIWGDNYGNRVDRFLACVAYLDGVSPSVVMCRGYYTRTVLAAWDFKDGQLTSRWVFDSDDGTPGNSSYRGQGNHNLSVADVDGDGRDEIIYGSCTINDDGTGLYSTGLGHGDALHVSDMDPGHPGLEVWMPHEGSASGATFREAATGEILLEHYNSGDVGRGCAAHIDSRYPGYQLWSYAAEGTYNTNGSQISTNRPPINFLLWWTGDLQRELLDVVGSAGTNTILNKWNGSSADRLLSLYSIPTSYSTASNNGTKGNPCLSGDIIGDWREEIILRSSDNTMLRIFTTTELTGHRIYTLMHDPQYRLAIAWQNVAYNQPPHPSFYIGQGMDTPPTPDIQLTPLQTGGLLREWWLGIEGNEISNLTSSASYPNNPAGRHRLSRFEGPSNWNDAYGTRVRGYLVPPQTGDYTFWVAADDSAQLRLSTDALDSHAQLIAHVDSWTDPQQWDKYEGQQSESMTLVAGQKYYIELLHKEGNGGDHFAVAWQGPTLTQQIIEGRYLIPWQDFLIGDLTGNGKVNMSDTLSLTDYWLDQDCALDLHIDMNGDCRVNLVDFSLIASNWLYGVGSGQIKTIQIQENEEGFVFVNGTIDSNNAGFTGSGFANTINQSGSYIEWAVTVPESGMFDLQWRYANGSGANTNRTGTVSIDGQNQIYGVNFPVTADWTTWELTSVTTLTLSEGSHMIRLSAETTEGLANIDWIEITGLSPAPGNN